jgi:hypothetical protein
VRATKVMEETKNLQDSVGNAHHPRVPHANSFADSRYCHLAVQHNVFERGGEIDAAEPLYYGFYRGHLVLPAAEFYRGMYHPTRPPKCPSERVP